MLVVAENDATEHHTASRAGAGLAGAGGGTVLALFAASWPDSSPFKQWAIYAIPSVSILLTAVYVWLQVKIANYVQEKEVASLIETGKQKLQTAMANPNTSDEHKSRLQSELEQLEVLEVERVMARVKSINVITAKDVQNFHIGEKNV